MLFVVAELVSQLVAPLRHFPDGRHHASKTRGARRHLWRQFVASSPEKRAQPPVSDGARRGRARDDVGERAECERTRCIRVHLFYNQVAQGARRRLFLLSRSAVQPDVDDRPR